MVEFLGFGFMHGVLFQGAGLATTRSWVCGPLRPWAGLRLTPAIIGSGG
jgi:hypothetical protein